MEKQDGQGNSDRIIFSGNLWDVLSVGADWQQISGLQCDVGVSGGGFVPLLKRVRRDQARKHFVCAWGVSFVLSLILILGYQLDRFGMTDGGVRGKGLILLRAFCLAAALFPFGDMLFGLIEGIPSGMDNREKAGRRARSLAFLSEPSFCCGSRFGWLIIPL